MSAAEPSRPGALPLDLDADERAIGPVAPSRHSGVCPICEWPYTESRTPVTRTSWGRVVHPACLAPPHPARRPGT